MGLVRDPENPNRRRLVAEPTIKRNKLRRNALEHKKGTEFSFSTTLLPTPIFCLTSLTAARGVQAGAFEGDFASCDELFNRPQFEDDVDWIPLDWKKEMAEEKIFPMSASTFVRIFRRCLLVMGCRCEPQVYAFRVGAGAELDGCLTPALRNFVISQSTDVYEYNYMTKRVRVDLARCRLGDLAGSNGLLFEYLRDLSIQRDPGAPIEITEDQRRYMESRNDVTKLREAYEKAKESGERAQIRKRKAALDLYRRQVEDLLIHDGRTKYFAEADRLRKLGLSTTHLRQPRPAGPREHSVLDMKSVRCRTEEPKTESRADEFSLGAMDWLPHYIAREKGKVIPSPVGSIECDLKLDNSQKSTCFLCPKDLCSRSALTKHYKAVHVPGAFNEPFNCPECRELGLGDVKILGASDWETHTAEVHGKAHSPKLTENLTTDPTTGTCFVCDGQLPTGAPRHYNTRSEVFTSGKLFRCPECSLGLGETSEYYSGDDMLVHLARVHSLPAIVRCVLCNHFSTQRGLATHARGRFKAGSSPATCPCCVVASGEHGALFHTFESWHVHAATSGHHHGLPNVPAPKVVGIKRKRGYAAGYPSPVLSPGGIDECCGKGDTLEANNDVLAMLPSPPASDVEEPDMPFKRARLCSPTGAAQEATTPVIDTLPN